MVYRILYADEPVPANSTDELIETFSPREGNEYEVEQIYCQQTAGLEYSLKIEERKLFDQVPAIDIADENNGLPWALTVRGGEDLSVLCSNATGAQLQTSFSIVINDSNASR